MALITELNKTDMNDVASAFGTASCQMLAFPNLQQILH